MPPRLPNAGPMSPMKSSIPSTLPTVKLTRVTGQLRLPGKVNGSGDRFVFEYTGADSAIAVNRLLKDGVKVTVPDEHGGQTIETLRVIDWTTPTNNDFFLTSQMWVAGDMYRRRCDLLGFVNGLPLVFIELKKPAVPLKSAFDDNLRDYRGQSVPQLFHPNAFILLSNGSDTKVGTLTSAWEHFFDWKRVDDEAEAGKVSLERALRGLLEPARLLDYVENFTVFEEGKGGLIKKTAKNHQFLGVNNAIAASLNG